MVGSSQLLANRSIETLKGVGPKLAEKLARLHIYTIADLLLHLPLRYQDRTRITPLGQLRPNDNVVIEGEVVKTDVVFGRRRSLQCRIKDTTGTVTLRFYYFSKAIQQRLQPGLRLRCYGEARRGVTGLEFYHPEIDYLDADKSEHPLPLEGRLTPIYGATDGVTQQKLRALVETALDHLNDVSLPELCGPEYHPYGRESIASRLAYLHHPPAHAQLSLLVEREHPVQQALIFEELMAHHLSTLKTRRQREQQSAAALAWDDALFKRFCHQLGFTLTGAQKRAIEEVGVNLQAPSPMLRLVQGDVGAGKTVVAAAAILQAVGAGRQAALMAPTELLARQHYINLQGWLEPLGISVEWLSGSLKASEKERVCERLANGKCQFVAGTHALIQDDVAFQSLALCVIDEQHRFGVHQRLALREKCPPGLHCHQLIMTATPIPRTLAMSLYADLDASIIDELPPGRTPVVTTVMSQQRREALLQRVAAVCEEGRQVYWVCTLIEESEQIEAQAAEELAEQLREELPEISVALIHGRMKTSDKDATMASFRGGDIQLLVATTVIEVGVDVPNATLMVIENSERLGLAQLHQLRGRVGRGSQESFCVLLYNPPLSRIGQERLAAMRETTDGFVIAERDLELRGPGEFLGTRQTGEVSFRLADLQRDGHMLQQVQHSARRLQMDTPAMAEALIERWIGRRSVYAGA